MSEGTPTAFPRDDVMGDGLCMRTPAALAAVVGDIFAERGVNPRETLIASLDPACEGTAREVADMLAEIRKVGA